MFTDDEKDYIMRMIKEIARVLASVMLGKKYVQVELPVESKYQISGDKLYHMKTMVDRGEINEAENELLDRIDYADKEALAEAMFFYEYAASKGDEFLEAHNYSLEEIRDGIQQLAEDAGYGNIINSPTGLRRTEPSCEFFMRRFFFYSYKLWFLIMIRL